MDVTDPLHSYGDVKPYEYDTPKPLYDVEVGAALVIKLELAQRQS